LDEAVRCAASQCLGIGIGANEFNALNVALDHVLDSVTAATAHADDFNLRSLIELFDLDHFNAHGALLKLLQLPKY
jgi:hypothetical protein